MAHSWTETPMKCAAVGAASRRARDSRSLMNFVLSLMLQSADNRGRRISIAACKAMFSTLRPAGRDGSKVYLSDLTQLDDEQFEQVIEGMRYLRNVSRTKM